MRKHKKSMLHDRSPQDTYPPTPPKSNMVVYPSQQHNAQVRHPNPSSPKVYPCHKISHRPLAPKAHDLAAASTYQSHDMYLNSLGFPKQLSLMMCQYGRCLERALGVVQSLVRVIQTPFGAFGGCVRTIQD